LWWLSLIGRLVERTIRIMGFAVATKKLPQFHRRHYVNNGQSPPVPVHPRLGVRAAYRLQRLLWPNASYRWLSARIEASAPARRLFTGAERAANGTLFGCRMCGQCALPVTGYVCPMGCPKELAP
jgi:hypothetical protein